MHKPFPKNYVNRSERVYRFDADKLRNYQGIFKDARDGAPMWLIWHRACGDPAFFYKKEPWLERNIRAELTVTLDGGEPEPKSPMVCGSCGKEIKKLDLLMAAPPRKKLISIPTIITGTRQ